MPSVAPHPLVACCHSGNAVSISTAIEKKSQSRSPSTLLFFGLRCKEADAVHNRSRTSYFLVLGVSLVVLREQLFVLCDGAALTHEILKLLVELTLLLLLELDLLTERLCNYSFRRRLLGSFFCRLAYQAGFAWPFHLFYTPSTPKS